jgi:hypothetical protein
MSKPGQKYLGNQLLQPRGKVPSMRTPGYGGHPSLPGADVPAVNADNAQGLIRLLQMLQNPPRGGGAH